MMNKRLVMVISMSIVFAIAAWLEFIDSRLTGYASGFLLTVKIFGFMTMLRNGTFVATRYFKITLAFFGVLLIGVFMAMLDLPGDEAILSIAIAGILITYSIHFLTKKSKTLLDIMKLITVLLLFPLPLWFFRPISGDTKDVVLLLGNVVFGITFVLYLLMRERKTVWEG